MTVYWIQSSEAFRLFTAPLIEEQRSLTVPRAVVATLRLLAFTRIICFAPIFHWLCTSRNWADSCDVWSIQGHIQERFPNWVYAWCSCLGTRARLCAPWQLKQVSSASWWGHSCVWVHPASSFSGRLLAHEASRWYSYHFVERISRGNS